jgi:riboflavin biosynthesis pyrimidine reductase
VLETLLDRTAGDALPLPAGLEARYGGPLRLPERAVFANFVSTIDGIVSFDVAGHDRAKDVSGGYAGDRFVLALLRAAADAVVVGAGTLRKEPDSVWTAESVFPEEAGAFPALRAALGRPTRPLTVIVTASGEIDLGLPAFNDGGPVVVATTPKGAEHLRGGPRHVTVRALGNGDALRASELVRLAAEMSGGGRILTEGGPNLFARFLEERALDDLFLTVAPRIAGRSRDARRTALVEGAAFLPANAPRARLASLKAADDYLFTRFAFARAS